MWWRGYGSFIWIITIRNVFVMFIQQLVRGRIAYSGIRIKWTGGGKASAKTILESLSSECGRECAIAGDNYGDKSELS